MATGLYFYGARYYDPSIGRFVSRDPAEQNPRDPAEQNPRDPQRQCRYAYARNNPEVYTDPSGACLSVLNVALALVPLTGNILGIWGDWGYAWTLARDVYIRYAIPFHYYLQRQDWWGFFWNVAVKAIISDIAKNLIWRFMPWWRWALLLGFVVSGTFLYKVVAAFANFVWTMAINYLWAPMGIC